MHRLKVTGKPKQKKKNRELIRWTGTAPRGPQKAGGRGARGAPRGQLLAPHKRQRLFTHREIFAASGERYLYFTGPPGADPERDRVQIRGNRFLYTRGEFLEMGV